jgi:plasmid stabilization system protein ParE
MNKLEIIWSHQAEAQVENIFRHYQSKSAQGALNLVKAILESPESIKYPEQYQVDEVNKNYRRIIVRGNYKVLYQNKGQIISIVAVVGTTQSPETIRKF